MSLTEINFAVGDLYTAQCTMSDDLMSVFKNASGDNNSVHTDDEYAKQHGFSGAIIYGNLLGLMVSNLVGMKLPIREVVIMKQSLDFRLPIYPDECVVLEGIVTSIHEAVSIVKLKLKFSTERGPVATGICVVKCLSKVDHVES